MSNLKVSQKSGPVVHGDQSVTHSHSTHHTDTGGDVHDQRHAHDNTPVQHRELETQGRQVRARVEGRSDNGLHLSQLSHGKKSTAQPPNGNPVNRGLDFDVQSNPGSQRSHGNPGHSRSFSIDHPSSNWQGQQQQSIQSGRQFQSNNPFSFNSSARSYSHVNHSGVNARIGETVQALRNEVGNILRGQSASTPEGQRGRLGSNYSQPRVERLGDNLRIHLNHPDITGEPRASNPNGDIHGRAVGHDNHGDNVGEDVQGRVNGYDARGRALGHEGHGHEGHGHAVDHDFQHPGFDLRENNLHELNHSLKVIDKLTNRLAQTAENRLRFGDSPTAVNRQTIADAKEITRFNKHFAELLRTGGEPVKRAYRSAIEFLLNERNPEATRLRLVSELLRDLRSGAFLHPQELETPFPLTGRAKIVSEMMELMRTLDAIEKFAQEMKVAGKSVVIGESLTIPLRVVANTEMAELFTRLLLELGPMFPGFAGRLEIPRFVSQLGGIPTDAQGQPLLTSDRVPLKLGELVWLNTWFESSSSFSVLDRFAARFTPLFGHGFDAVYSVIGFDGRSLSMPRFMAIQSQINGSDFEWEFGQAPLTEGWIRAAIELLKDSISVEHNVLGESLEEALTGDRFHMMVMRGTVEDGVAVPGSFSFSRAFN
jgi:hypothetical protein